MGRHLEYFSKAQKVRELNIVKTVKAVGLDFCKETTIHGCRFLVEDIDNTGKTYIRRLKRVVSLIVWTPVIMFGAAFAIYLMVLVWSRYQTTPTITTIETNNYPIWNVPFPGVTICNVNSVYEPKIHNVSQELLKRGFSSAAIETFFQSLAALVNFREVDSSFLRIFQALEDLGYSTEKLMFQLAQPCENLLKECVWLGKAVPCASLFRLAKSARGFCCSFNYKALRSSLEMRLKRVVSLIVWTPVIMFGAAFAIYLMVLVWSRYQTTPTITTIETNNYPIWNVPFPGVTICNVNSVYEPKIHNVSLELLKRGFSAAAIETFFQSLAALVNFQEVDSSFLRIFQALEDLGYSTEKLMFQLAQPCENLLKECVWLGKAVPCASLFRLAKSARGFCCSFNYKALRSSLEIETKADDYYQINTPVIRIFGAGEDVGLILLLDVEMDAYVAPKRQFYGTEIIIHDAEDFPEQTLISAYGQPGDEVSIAVVPSVVVTEASVKSLPISLRFCRFSNEKPLRITKKYSFQSCMTECRADSISEKCACLPYFFPRFKSQDVIRQCTLKDIKCLSDNKHFFNSLQPSDHFDGEDKEKTMNSSKVSLGMSCDCLPSCSEQVYNIETFITKLFKDSSGKFGPFTTRDISANSTVVKVYFKDLSCIKYRREIFMTWDDMLASFGGIFGLCLGGSVLSLIEIVYYATFKLYAKILHRKQGWSEDKLLGEKNKIYLNEKHAIRLRRRKFTHLKPNLIVW